MKRLSIALTLALAFSTGAIVTAHADTVDSSTNTSPVVTTGSAVSTTGSAITTTSSGVSIIQDNSTNNLPADALTASLTSSSEPVHGLITISGLHTGSSDFDFNMSDELPQYTSEPTTEWFKMGASEPFSTKMFPIFDSSLSGKAVYLKFTVDGVTYLSNVAIVSNNAVHIDAPSEINAGDSCIVTVYNLMKEDGDYSVQILANGRTRETTVSYNNNTIDLTDDFANISGDRYVTVIVGSPNCGQPIQPVMKAIKFGGRRTNGAVLLRPTSFLPYGSSKCKVQISNRDKNATYYYGIKDARTNTVLALSKLGDTSWISIPSLTYKNTTSSAMYDLEVTLFKRVSGTTEPVVPDDFISSDYAFQDSVLLTYSRSAPESSMPTMSQSGTDGTLDVSGVDYLGGNTFYSVNGKVWKLNSSKIHVSKADADKNDRVNVHVFSYREYHEPPR